MSVVTWKTGFEQIGKGVYAFYTDGTTMMSNCVLVEGSECALLFDVLCTRSLTQAFLDECRRYTQKPIHYLVLSHCHGDHFLGAAAVPDSILLTHESGTASLERDRANPPFERLQKRQPHLDYSDAVVPVPDVLLKAGCTIDLGGRKVEIRHMGHCHTPGDLGLFIPDEKLAALADVLFSGIVPATVSGNLDCWITVLEQLEQSGYDRFVPGHGPMCRKKDLVILRDYLDGIREQARAVEAGQLTLCDELPSPMEQKMIDAGWRETARALFSTEQYQARLSGRPYAADMPRIMRLEKERAEKYHGEQTVKG